MHFICTKTIEIENRDVLICPICIKKEIDLDVFHLNKIQINNTKINEIKKKKILNKDNIDISIYKTGFRRMKDIDKNQINKNKNLLNDSIRAKQKIKYSSSIEKNIAQSINKKK